MTTYSLETQDMRECWHRFKIINNVSRIEITPRHYIFLTEKGTNIKLRTDTWHRPVEILDFIKIHQIFSNINL